MQGKRTWHTLGLVGIDACKQEKDKAKERGKPKTKEDLERCSMTF